MDKRQNQSRIFRFAPSPNGELHLGHAYSALLNHDMAVAVGGKFLLRIEDVDTGRARAEFEKQIYEDLHWLGIGWEQPVLRQSERSGPYRQAIMQLFERGLAYPACLSRREIAALVALRQANGDKWPCDPDGSPHYPGPERDWSREHQQRIIESGKPVAWRLDMQAAMHELGDSLQWCEYGEGDDQPKMVNADPLKWGDFVLAGREAAAAYMLAVVVDDAHQGVTDVVRGEDLSAASAPQRLLQVLLGLPEPGYRHHGLILDDQGRKLSKRWGSQSLKQLRSEGKTPDEIRRMVQLRL